MVNVLASDDRSNGVALFLADLTRALELGSFLFETGLDSLRVAMLVVTLLDTHHGVLVLLGQSLTVLDGLNRGMIVVLVDLTVDSGSSLLMTLLNDLLIHDSGSDFLVDGGVMVTRLGPRAEDVSLEIQQEYHNGHDAGRQTRSRSSCHQSSLARHTDRSEHEEGCLLT